MLINNISDPSITLVITVLSNFEEILFRLTAYRRDFMSLKFLYGDIPKELSDFHATIMNIDMILELLAILVAPAMMYFFLPYGFMFNWYGGQFSALTTFGVMGLQLLSEF